MSAAMRTRAAVARAAALLALAALAVAGTRAQRARAAPPPVHFGVIAEEPSEPDRMFRIYEPFIDALGQRLAPAGITMGPLVIARDLEDMSQRLVRHQVDFVLETVFPTLALRESSHRLEPALLVVRRGEREYRSVFFTRLESPIRALPDLRGRTLVLQVLRSTSAFALPRAELARAGIPLVPADDAGSDRRSARYVLALAEINQAIWVLHGKGDAGAFNEGDWLALPDAVRARLRVFARTRPIVRGLIAIRSDLQDDTRRSLEQAMLTLEQDEAGRAALRQASVTRFERLSSAQRQAVLDWGPLLLATRGR
jgi:phosphonate transport system substrate-binding protein